MSKNIKKNIEKLLFKSNISMYEVSKETGIAQTTLSRYTRQETDLDNMRLGHAIKLNDFYNKNKGEIEMDILLKVIEAKKESWIGNVLEFYICEDDLVEKMVNENREDVEAYILELLEKEERLRDFDYYQGEEDEESAAHEDGFTWIDEISKWVKLD